MGHSNVYRSDCFPVVGREREKREGETEGEREGEREVAAVTAAAAV